MRQRLLMVMATCMVGAAAAQAETVNRILAVVDDQVITQADVNAFIAALVEESGSAAVQPDAPEIRRVALQQLIDQQLMLKEAKRAGVTVESDEVLERYERFRSRFPSDEAYRQSLAEAGLSEELMKRRVREQFMVQRILQGKVRPTVVVSPQEVASEIARHPELAATGDRMRISHLLVRVDGRRSEAEAKELVDRIIQQAQAGADFAALAREHSEDQYRSDGGDMGWVAPGEFMPELDAAMKAMAPGELSAPIRSTLGFHLVKLVERRPAASLSETEANRRVYERLFQEKFKAAMGRWLNELRRGAYIEIIDPALNEQASDFPTSGIR